MISAALAVVLTLAAPVPWSRSLCLGNGGIWRERIPIEIANAGEHDGAGSPVTVRIGKRPGEADLTGANVSALRVCNAHGDEMLFDLTGPSGDQVRSGPIPAGAALTIPIECPAHSRSAYYAYFGNARAWSPPDNLQGTGTFRNGGFEAGEGDTPTGWAHDAADASHRASWTAETSHTGRKCLKTEVAAGAEKTWISARQTNLRIVGGAHYVMTAWVKAHDVEGFAGWYIHVGNEQSPMVISPMLTAGSGTFDWKEVRAEFKAPSDADLADLGTVLRGTGTAWFDDVILERLDGGDVQTAAAGPRERLDVRETGATAAWWSGTPGDRRRWDFRTPARVVNLSDDPATGALVSVDLSSALARLQGKASADALQVVSGGKAIPHYCLGDLLLFSGDAPARTIKTYWVYLSSGSQAGRPSGTANEAGPVQYAANPAIPGGQNLAARRMVLREYTSLLASPRNLARNPSFESGASLPDFWPGGAEGERPAGTEMDLSDGGLFGKRCARIHVPAGSRPAWVGWRQDAPVQPNRTYLYAAWLKCKNLEGGLQIHAHLRTETGELVRENAMTGAGPALNGTQDWTLISGMFTTPDDCRRFQMHLTMLATGTAWHDGVVLMEVSPGDVGGVGSRPLPARAGLAFWPVNAIVKVFHEDTPPERNAAARITCARNEYEPLQLAIRSPRAIGGVRAVVQPPVGPHGAALKDTEVGIVGYVPIDHKSNYYSNRTPAYYRKTPTGPGACDGWAGWWPDPLLPRSTFDLAAGQTQPIWVTAKVPNGAPAGDYRGVVTLQANGTTLASMPFTVHVWDFALPERRRLKAIFDTRQSGAMWRVPGRSEQQTRIAFWRFLAEHRVCPDQVQPEPSLAYRDGKVIADFTEYDRAAKVYFDELKFPHAYTPGMFYLFGWGHLPGDKFGEKPYTGEYPYEGVDRSELRPEFKRAYQACLRAYWDHVKKKGWSDRITLYISDEPYDSDPKIRAQMKALCRIVQEVDPSIPIYSSTWHHQPEWDGLLTVWGLGHYGVVPVKKMEELRAGGATLWWTTDGQMCTDTPYCAIERLLPHYCFKYGAKAYEFWGVDWLTYDPYRYGFHTFLLHDFGPGQAKEWVRYPNGDGFLAYPPGPLKLDRPVPSIRLEQAREGEEDYEYLALLRDLVERGRAAGRDVSAGVSALSVAESLVDSPCEIGRYSTRILPGPDRVFRVKEMVARAIEKLERPVARVRESAAASRISAHAGGGPRISDVRGRS